MKLKKLLIFVLCALLSVTMITGCNKNDDPGNNTGSGETKRLTVYLSDYIAGSQDAAVKAAIEEKFEKDTGIKIDLNFRLYSMSDFNVNFGNVVSRETWDAAVSYIGHAGINQVAIDLGAAAKLNDLLDLYGTNIKKVVDEDALKATSYANGDLMALPSVNNSKSHGVLIRKDWMDRVGYTIDPADTTKTLLKT